VVPARIVRAAGRRLDPGTALRELADTHVTVVKRTIRVFDLIAVLRSQRCRNAVMTRDGTLESADSVVGVVTWEDLVENTNLSDYLDHEAGSKV
jgi:CBS domain containing-hemolysin-like protein